MHRLKSVNHRFHWRAQALIRRRHIGKHRVATQRGYNLGVQHRGHRRLGSKCLVAMPNIGEGWRIFFRVVEHDHFGMLRQVCGKRMHREVAKTATKRHLFFDGQLLVMKDENPMLGQSTMEHCHGGSVERFPEIDTADLSANVGL